MNKTLQSVLAVTGVIVGLILAISAGYYTYYYSKSIQPSAYRSFTVSGEGKVTAVPNIATFTFSVVTEGGKDVAVLQKENNEKINQAIEYLKSNGVEAKDIKTQDFSMYPRYQYYPCESGRPCPPAEVIGYTISQSVAVKVRDLEKSGTLLSGVIGYGATNLSQLSFTIDDPSELQNQARIEAIADAKEKAEEIARNSGFKLGKILNIDEGASSPMPMPYYAGYEMLKSDTAAPATPAPSIEPGSQEVIVTVTVRYEIQ